MTEDDTANMLKYGKCNYCISIGCEMHTCPYSEDVRSDYSTLCNCCEDCQQRCASDI